MFFTLILLLWLLILHVFISPKRFNVIRDDIKFIIWTILRPGWRPITIMLFIATLPWTIYGLYFLIIIIIGFALIWDAIEMIIHILFILLLTLPITALYLTIIHLIRKQSNEIDDLIRLNIIHTLIFIIVLVTLSLIAFGISSMLEIPVSIDLSKNILIWWLCILGISIIVFFYRNYHIFKQHIITCWIYTWVILAYCIWLYIHIISIYNMADFPESIFKIFMIYSDYGVFGLTIQAILFWAYLIIINTIYIQRFYQKNLESERLFITKQPSMDISGIENKYKISNSIIYGLTILSLFIIPIFNILFWHIPKTLETILFYSMWVIPILFLLSFWRFTQSLNKNHGDIVMYSSTILVIILFFLVWLTPAEAWWLQHIIVVILTPAIILMSIRRFIDK